MCQALCCPNQPDGAFILIKAHNSSCEAFDSRLNKRGKSQKKAQYMILPGDLTKPSLFSLQCPLDAEEEDLNLSHSLVCKLFAQTDLR